MDNAQKFILLFSNSRSYQSNKEMMESLADWQKWMQELAQKDIFVSGEQLEPKGKRIVGSKKQVMDGPFTETKEVISGLIIIKAKDLDTAVTIAKECPIFDFDGDVEVRPLMQLN